LESSVGSSFSEGTPTLAATRRVGWSWPSDITPIGIFFVAFDIERIELKNVKRKLARGAVGLLALALIAIGVIYALSAYRIGKRYEIVPRDVAVSNDPATIARGERLARIHGCHACHGDGLEGEIAVDDFRFGRFVIPNVTVARDAYSDLDLVRLFRHGVRSDGKGVLPIMPSQSFTHLADDDLGAIIAYLRSVPEVANELPTTRLGPLLRAMLALGRIEVAPRMIDHARPALETVDRDDAEVFGRYLASTTCTECHGQDLQGQDGFLVTPSLAITAAYTEPQFRDLLRSGVALGGREVGAMSEVATRRFAHYTNDEIHALHRYLTSLAVEKAAE
jgi:mono/diheme cytochrome c family protein